MVIELKISHNTVQDDLAKAKEALCQILTCAYMEGLDAPILLDLAMNEPKRQATTWVKRTACMTLTSERSQSPPNQPRRLLASRPQPKHSVRP
ncbi:MAG: hypothetical protein LBI10_00765 [Deltaproteobacteria bacterium]|nr:hypothetical protein [Deltaproteobacteria bacterium]